MIITTILSLLCAAADFLIMSRYPLGMTKTLWMISGVLNLIIAGMSVAL